MPSNHLILYCPILLLPSIVPSIRVFSSVSVLHIRWPKYWSFSFGISPSNEYSGLISFRINWFDLIAVRGSLESLLQLRSLKASVLWLSVFLMVQLSHLYMTTGKTMCVCMLSCVWHFATPWTIAGQAPLSMNFSRWEYWSGLPFPPPGDLPDPGIEPTSLVSPALTGRFFTTSATWQASALTYGPLSVKWWLCFSTLCLGLS